MGNYFDNLFDPNQNNDNTTDPALLNEPESNADEDASSTELPTPDVPKVTKPVETQPLENTANQSVIPPSTVGTNVMQPIKKVASQSPVPDPTIHHITSDPTGSAEFQAWQKKNEGGDNNTQAAPVQQPVAQPQQVAQPNAQEPLKYDLSKPYGGIFDEPPAPTYDADRQKRIQNIARLNALGDTLGNLVQAVGYGAGAPVAPRNENNVEPYLQNYINYQDQANKDDQAYQRQEYIDRINALKNWQENQKWLAGYNQKDKEIDAANNRANNSLNWDKDKLGLTEGFESGENDKKIKAQNDRQQAEFGQQIKLKKIEHQYKVSEDNNQSNNNLRNGIALTDHKASNKNKEKTFMDLYINGKSSGINDAYFRKTYHKAVSDPTYKPQDQDLMDARMGKWNLNKAKQIVQNYTDFDQARSNHHSLWPRSNQ